MGWFAYSSPRDQNNTGTDHSATGATPAVVKEASALGDASLARLDADASSNSLSAQFFAGTVVAVPIGDAVSFAFSHQSSTDSSDGSAFIRIAIQVNNADWYVTETAFAESPDSAALVTFQFENANWVPWEDPTDGFSNLSAVDSSGGNPITEGTLTRIGLTMASGRTSDYMVFDDVALMTTSLPPPSAPDIELDVSGGGQTLQVPSQSGYLYQVRGTDSLGTAPSTWPVIGEAQTGDGNVLSFPMEDPTTLPAGAKRFYSIEVSTP